ncbi:hypothetical protein ACFL6C_01855 [Myxococcota bacterium]
MQSLKLPLSACLLGILACIPETTSPEASESLARAMLERLDTKCASVDIHTKEQFDAQTKEHYENFGERRIFCEIEKGIDLDGQIRATVGEFWSPNPIGFKKEEDAEELTPNQDYIGARSAWTKRYSERLRAFKKKVLARIERDANDTAARGLLGLAILWMLHEQRLEIETEVYHLLNEHFLDSEFSLPTPECECRDLLSRPCKVEELYACRIPMDLRGQLRERALRAANIPLVQLHSLNPSSAWLELARRFTAENSPFGCGLTPAGLRGELAWGEDGKLPRVELCHGKPVTDLDSYVAVTPNHILVGDQRIADLQEGRVVEEGLQYGAMLTRPLAQTLEQVLKLSFFKPSPRAKGFDKRMAKSFSKACENDDLNALLRSLYGCDREPLVEWRLVEAKEVLPLSCANPDKAGRFVPKVSKKGAINLAVHDAARLPTVESVYCSLSGFGYAVSFVLMPEHGPEQRPWDNPEPCALPYPCASSETTSAAECKALETAMVSITATRQ